MKNFYPIAIITLFIVSSCAPTLTTTAVSDPLKVVLIKFGSGGGFTGKSTSTTLDLRSGKMSNSDNTHIKSLGNLDLNDIVGSFNLEELMQLKYSKPGNYTNHIELISENQTNKFQWANNDSEVPSNIKELFEKLLQLK